jgi:cytochrome c-type biogenesis protein CcmF
MAEGDTLFYSKGYMILNQVVKNPVSNKFNFPVNGPAVLAEFTIKSTEGNTYHAAPMIVVDSFGINQIDDTVYAQNLYVKFAGVSSDQTKMKIGVKESSTIIDFVTLKAYIFPYINLVWIGLIIMAIGLVISMIQRASLSKSTGAIVLAFAAIAMFYMFLLAN